MWRWGQILAAVAAVATIVGLFAKVYQLAQDKRNADAERAGLATQNAYQGQQLDLSRQQVTLLAGERKNPATATFVAQQVAELESASVALPASWIERSSDVPETGTSLARDLTPGEILYLSGGSFSVNGIFCGNDSMQICVLIYEATFSQRVAIDRLVAKNNYLARALGFTYDELVTIHEPYYWKWPNCRRQEGCAKATIYYLRDGLAVDSPAVIFRP
jgi:hypothetical protein